MVTIFSTVRDELDLSLMLATEWYTVPMSYFNKKKVAGYRTGASIIVCYLDNNVILAVLSTIHMGAVRCHITVPRKIFDCQSISMCNELRSDVSRAKKMPVSGQGSPSREIRKIAMIWYPAGARSMKDAI